MVTDEELSSWASWMRAAGRPATTIGLRTYQVRRVLHTIGVSPWSVTTEDLVRFLADQPWAAETRRSYRAALRAFYAWGQASGRRPDSPAHLLPAIKVPRGVPRPTPDVIYRGALAEAGPRERLMVLLAAVCGLRRGEISRVRRDDVSADLIGFSLRVVGKGGHVRDVPLPDGLAVQLLDGPPGWVFPSPKIPGGHLTEAHVGVLVSRLMPEGWTCHTLRHRCATVGYASTRDLRAIQELLGHAKPETTALYTQVPPNAIRAAIEATAA